jgi:hypothetical protein
VGPEPTTNALKRYLKSVSCLNSVCYICRVFVAPFVAHAIAKLPRKTFRQPGTPAKVEASSSSFIGRLSALKNPLQAEAREITVFTGCQKSIPVLQEVFAYRKP